MGFIELLKPEVIGGHQGTIGTMTGQLDGTVEIFPLLMDSNSCLVQEIRLPTATIILFSLLI